MSLKSFSQIVLLAALLVLYSCQNPSVTQMGSVTYNNDEKESVDLLINGKQVASIASGSSYTDTETAGDYTVEAKAYVLLLDYEAVYGQTTVTYSSGHTSEIDL
jgi:hypothetical protein